MTFYKANIPTLTAHKQRIKQCQQPRLLTWDINIQQQLIYFQKLITILISIT